jgi:hypothetical protein
MQEFLLAAPRKSISTEKYILSFQNTPEAFPDLDSEIVCSFGALLGAGTADIARIVLIHETAAEYSFDLY